MVHNGSRAPLIAIVGATGTGKSELAVEIASKHNGEIINGDAMQLYAGLPIITNKILAEERKGILHHLLGCIGLDEQTWTVGDFVTSALQKIKEIRGRGKLPILVGGTHYYTQSLLFHEALTEKAGDGTKHVSSGESQWPILDASTEEILARLFEVDPVMANRWQPKDRRKIRRSLEIYLQTGRKASEIYEEQRARRQGAHTGDGAAHERSDEDAEAASTLRMRTLVLWVNAESDTLTKRLDSRVDKMIKSGLLDEVQTLTTHVDQVSAVGQEIDQTRGIWVAIGYKEFLDYQRVLKEGSTDESQLATLRASAVEKTQIATRQYAKRQIRWIRIKLNHAITEAGAKDHFYMLDSSDLSQWQTNVANKGVELAGLFLREEDMPAPSSLSAFAEEMLTPKGADLSANKESWFREHCEVCNMTAVRESEWLVHVKSRKHRRAMTNKTKRDLRAERETAMQNGDAEETVQPESGSEDKQP